MLDTNSLRYYKIIGKLHSVVEKADDFQAAIKEGLKVILDNSNADYASVWYYNKSDSMLHPYYWICPVDLTSVSYKPGEGSVGKTFEAQNIYEIFDFTKNPLPEPQKDYAGVNISSYLCVPFSGDTSGLGCIEFIKSQPGSYFNEDDVDVYRILTLLTEMALEEAPAPTENRRTKRIISVRDIEKSYKSGEVVTKVLRGVNFDVFEGEFLCFLGESGCGKSTMLNIIGGMDNADKGSFIFDDKEMFDADQAALTKLRRDNIGFIFQAYNLMPNLNVKQNLDLIGELVKDPMDSVKALSLVGMDQKQNNYPSQLSGGQQQRVSIARALVKKPKLILADEPTAALDYTTSIEVLTALEDVIASGTTLIMVTHNEEITRMADRVIRFRNGQTYEITINNHPAKAKDLVW